MPRPAPAPAADLYANPADLAAAEAAAVAAAEAYYNTGDVTMDDAAYDALAARIAATHAAHPDWADGSTARRVGGGASGGEVTHRHAMLSLDNVFDDGELGAWWDGFRAAGGKRVCVEPKLDGVAISLTYRAGALAVAATRGDGERGEDVTAAVRRARGVPATLALPGYADADGVVEVRGEVVMTDGDFAAANAEREAAGERPFVNPRNATAGTLRRDGSTAPLTFAAYDVVGADDHDLAMTDLEAGGVLTARQLTGGETGAVDRADDVAARIAGYAARRATLGVGIDGAVVKANDAASRRHLGDNGRAPRWAVAYKYPADLRLTRLNDIVVSVGRTGVLTPVAMLEPVFVGGATVAAASLANPAEVVRKDLRVGDQVWVRRAGDVIPEVTGVHLESRDPAAVAWAPPTACPRCGSPVDTSSRRWRCAGRTCGLAEAVAYLGSRKALDIDGLGGELADRLVGAGLVGDIADVFTLTADDVAALPRMGDVSAAALVARIADAKGRDLGRVICALGVTGTGSRLSRRLAARFGSLDALLAATADELSEVDGIGPVKAADIAAELADLGGVAAKLAAAGVTTRADSPAGGTGTAGGGPAGPLAGQVVVVTGKVPGMSRDAAAAAVERLGGVAATSVSGRTSLVVVGDGGGGSKLAKAEKLGVATMPAAEFARLAAS
jgi:DNA ligase (NAD+)